MRRLFNKIIKNSRSLEDGIFFEKITKILKNLPITKKHLRIVQQIG
jgi:ribonuclease III